MADNLKNVIEENKKSIIIAVILWLVLTIVLVMPVAFGIFGATYKGHGFNMSIFMQLIGKTITSPFSAFGETVSRGGFGVFLATEIGFTLLFAMIIVIAKVKNGSKHEYKDMEHGSSDWSRGGSQYQILNKNKGIILAENNYLPVDKRGNVNVLVVGRIRFW